MLLASSRMFKLTVTKTTCQSTEPEDPSKPAWLILQPSSYVPTGFTYRGILKPGSRVRFSSDLGFCGWVWIWQPRIFPFLTSCKYCVRSNVNRVTTVRRWLEVVNDLKLTLVNQLGPDKRFPLASRHCCLCFDICHALPFRFGIIFIG